MARSFFPLVRSALPHPFGIKQNRFPRLIGPPNLFADRPFGTMPAVSRHRGVAIRFVRMGGLRARTKEKPMKTPKYELQISRPRTEGKIIAYVRIQMSFLWVSFRLDRVNCRVYLNAPANFVDSLKGRPKSNGGTHSGWIDWGCMRGRLSESGLGVDTLAKNIGLFRKVKMLG